METTNSQIKRTYPSVVLLRNEANDAIVSPALKASVRYEEKLKTLREEKAQLIKVIQTLISGIESEEVNYSELEEARKIVFKHQIK